MQADACLAAIYRALFLFWHALVPSDRFLSVSTINPPCVSTAGRGYRFDLRLILTFEGRVFLFVGGIFEGEAYF